MTIEYQEPLAARAGFPLRLQLVSGETGRSGLETAIKITELLGEQ
jgi:hypothetical protein